MSDTDIALQRMSSRSMNYLSVCSGVEAATVAWHPLGWKPIAFSEIEPFPSAVLAHHYPTVPNLGDMNLFNDWNLNDSIDILVGGTPCQSFSVAGLRKGLEDPRGNLALVYCGILDYFRPQWFVWENVPGVLSSNSGRDFGSFLGALAELGYGFAYRVLDAQYFGVAQRRRRVFVVGYLGNWRPAAKVLFERESVRGDSAPSREKRQEAARVVAPSLTASNDPSRSPQSSEVTQQVYSVLQATESVAKCLITKTRLDSETENLIPTYAIQGSMIGRGDNAGPQGDGINEEVCFTQNTTDRHAVAQPITFSGQMSVPQTDVDMSATLQAKNPMALAQPVAFDGYNQTLSATSQTIRAGSTGGDHIGMVMSPTMAVRRLTPIECERLQGFPDNYTNIPWRKAIESPDGPRYKALGNSMAVPVMAWIGERIASVECSIREDSLK